MSGSSHEVTHGTLLDGKILYRQLARGHRSGFEPVLLAAAVPARPGESVLEAGTGAGAALLCLARRVPGLKGTGLEIDPLLTALAQENFTINNFGNNLKAICADATTPADATFDHIFSNPPWHDPAGTLSPDAARALARHAKPGLLEAWISSLAPRLKDKGTLTLILPAPALPDAIAALTASRLRGIKLFPLWPRAGRPAGQFIIAAQKAVKTPSQILPGLVLHDEHGITAQANAILKECAALQV